MLLLYILLCININLIWVDHFRSILYIYNYGMIAVSLHNITNNICSYSYPVCHINYKRVLNDDI